MHNRKVPMPLMEQYAMGELTEKQKAALENEFGKERLLGMAENLERNNREFFLAHPALVIPAEGIPAAREATPVIRKAKRFFARPYFYASLSAAAALLVVFLGVLPLLRTGGYAQGPDSAGIRIKGAAPQLFVYRQTLPEPELLPDKALVKENDVLQIKYNTGAYSFGAIFAIDGRGNVTMLLPDRDNKPAQAEPFKTDLLDYGYQLDDAPEFERFFLITSEKEFDLHQVILEAERIADLGLKAATADLKLPKGLTQNSILLTK